MRDIATLLQLIDHHGDLTEIRTGIADLIAHHLEAKRHALGYWQTAHFTNAIGSLSVNVHSPRQPTRLCLKSCLADLAKAIDMIDDNDAAFTPRKQSAKALTYEQLLHAIEALRKHF